VEKSVPAVEAPIDPALEITDAHHHFDDVDPPYLLEDLWTDTRSGHHVTRTIFVECGWSWDDGVAPELAPVGEVRRVASLARESRSPDDPAIAAIVGHADLRGGASAGRTLDHLLEAGGERFVGIRHATAWDADPAVQNHRTRPVAGLMGEPSFRAGFTELARRGLTFDAWLFHPQLPELAALARAFPETRIVVDHLGGPLAIGSYEGRAAEVDSCWRHNLTQLERCENVFLKLGGIGMATLGRPLDRGAPLTSVDLARHWSDRINWCIDLFGAERCMFESNFPMGRAACSYVVVWNTFKRIVGHASGGEKAALFSATARRFYGIPAS